MLTITSSALAVIRRVTGHRRLDQDSGVRIARTRAGSDRLQVSAVDAPASGDVVLERDGGRLYLGPEAVDRVRGAELDAVDQGRDRVQFVLRTG